MVNPELVEKIGTHEYSHNLNLQKQELEKKTTNTENQSVLRNVWNENKLSFH